MSSPTTPSAKEGSPSPPNSAECNKSSTAASPSTDGDGFSDAQIKQLTELLQPIVESQAEICNSLSNLETMTDILIEEKARKMAARQFGEDFSRSFIIKSPYDLVKLLANGNMNKLQKNDYEARHQAVGKLVELLKKLLPIFGKVAVEAVHKTLENNAEAFQNDAFDTAKAIFQEGAIDHIKNATEPDSLKSLDWKNICRVTLLLVQDLSSTKLDGEDDDSPAFQARVKTMDGRFKRKLERLKAAFEKGDLSSYNSPGVMLLSALAAAGEEVWKGGETTMHQWIEDKCNVFSFKDQIGCDLMPSVSAVCDHATIMVGEIKSALSDYSYKKARDQMLSITSILHFGLFYVIGENFQSVVKKGHLYALDAERDDQRLSAQVDEEISIFVHNAF